MLKLIGDRIGCENAKTSYIMLLIIQRNAKYFLKVMLARMRTVRNLGLESFGEPGAKTRNAKSVIVAGSIYIYIYIYNVMFCCLTGQHMEGNNKCLQYVCTQFRFGSNGKGRIYQEYYMFYIICML